GRRRRREHVAKRDIVARFGGVLARVASGWFAVVEFVVRRHRQPDVAGSLCATRRRHECRYHGRVRRTLSVIILGAGPWILAVGGGRLAAADRNPLTIYFIDVEGGQSTLIVTPDRESMLVDAGYPAADDRDVNRIMTAFADAGVTALDYLFVTHYHQDH